MRTLAAGCDGEIQLAAGAATLGGSFLCKVSRRRACLVNPPCPGRKYQLLLSGRGASAFGGGRRQAEGAGKGRRWGRQRGKAEGQTRYLGRGKGSLRRTRLCETGAPVALTRGIESAPSDSAARASPQRGAWAVQLRKTSGCRRGRALSKRCPTAMQPPAKAGAGCRNCKWEDVGALAARRARGVRWMVTVRAGRNCKCAAAGRGKGGALSRAYEGFLSHGGSRLSIGDFRGGCVEDQGGQQASMRTQERERQTDYTAAGNLLQQITACPGAAQKLNTICSF